MTNGDLISRQAVLDIFGDIHPLDYNARAYVAQIKELPSEKVDGDLISRQKVKDLIRGLTKWSVRSQDGKFVNVGLLYDDVMFGIDRLPGAEKTAEETNLTSEELFALDIEQNVKDIDSGEDDSYYRGRLAGMLSAYRILNGKPYEEKETD